MVGRKIKKIAGRKIVVFCLLLGVFLTGCGIQIPMDTSTDNPVEAQPESSQELQVETAQESVLDSQALHLLEDQLARSVVQIIADDIVGSGVLVTVNGEKLQILTAAHVLEQRPEVIRVRFSDQFEVEATTYSMAAYADVAMIEVEAEQIPEEHLAEYAAIERETVSPEENGQTVILMGSNTEPAGQMYQGTLLEPWIYVEDYGQHMLLVQGQVILGMSGGGVFSQKGALLGIISGTNEEETVAVPVSVIETEFANIL